MGTDYTSAVAPSVNFSAAPRVMAINPPRINRKDLKPGEVLCAYCTAKCCRYFALPIDTPTDRNDFEHLRWYMLHGRISLFVEDETWYLMVHNDCEALQEDNRCGIYEDRPGICRKYTTDECEYDDDAVYDRFFETPDQIWEYAQAVLPDEFPLPRRSESPADVSLPVVSV
jgi:uncharacterized protein